MCDFVNSLRIFNIAFCVSDGSLKILRKKKMILSSSRISESNLPTLIICMCDFVNSLRITCMIRLHRDRGESDRVKSFRIVSQLRSLLKVQFNSSILGARQVIRVRVNRGPRKNIRGPTSHQRQSQSQSQIVSHHSEKHSGPDKSSESESESESDCFTSQRASAGAFFGRPRECAFFIISVTLHLKHHPRVSLTV